jgi:Tol biopolymer transport system component
MRKSFILVSVCILLVICNCEIKKSVPHQDKWGIYALELATENIELIYSSANEMHILRLNNTGNKFVFDQAIDSTANEKWEICTINTDGSGFFRVTDNLFWDLYPVWSPDGSQFAFLSLRDSNLDIYLMSADGSNIRKLYDSGFHDADIDWCGNTITYTSQFKIWSITDSGTQPFRITNPVNAGQWGIANLPIGDYDPRFNSDGTKIVFERLENPDSSVHGRYNFFIINTDGTNEIRLTNTGYAQGLASWSNAGDKIVYVVAAINNAGKYDIYMMNSDGSDNHNITPSYFPDGFLCYAPIFAKNDSIIYFIGQWWE